MVSASPILSAAPAVRAADGPVPHYEHIFIIVAENKGYEQIFGSVTKAPNLNRLAHDYGLASEFYAETHPSEPNYIAMVGGDTYNITDDDAFYCTSGFNDRYCPGANRANYPDHTIRARSLVDQLEERKLTWKAYLESLPEPGSLVARWPNADHPVTGEPNELYAAKHNGFISFERVQHDPQRASKIVGFQQLEHDLASGTLPNYAHIVPNQCNDMHGRAGANTPPDCLGSNIDGLIARGDRVIGELVQKLMASAAWKSSRNTAIVITFDENDKDERHSAHQGCCGYDPQSNANFGGGRIPTIVLTNHGVRQLVDSTPYNHYSLLRTTEAAFGIDEYLGHAAEESRGVVTMSTLFAVKP
jgi:phospholipase C